MPQLNAIRRATPLKAELRGEISAKQPDWLSDAIATTVHAERGQVKAIAAALGVRESAVYEAADANHPHALKAWWIPTICRETTSFAILDALEHQVGRVAFELPSVLPELSDVVAETARLVSEFGDTLAAVSAAIADHTITDAECAVIAGQIADVHVALASLQALVARRAEAA